MGEDHMFLQTMIRFNQPGFDVNKQDKTSISFTWASLGY